jgi:hypothetical protein
MFVVEVGIDFFSGMIEQLLEKSLRLGFVAWGWSEE